MQKDGNSPLEVSALIVVRREPNKPLEVLNVLAHNKTKYGFPGGKLEDGESPEAAVIRETEEELGVTPSSVVYKDTFESFTPEGRGIRMHVFTGSVPGDISPNAEIKELHWLTYEQMISDMDMLTSMTIEHVLPLIRNLG